jgi:acyl-CoA thioesterase I
VRRLVLTAAVALLAVTCGLVAVPRTGGAPAAGRPAAVASVGQCGVQGPVRRPLLAVVGASVAAGVGAGNPDGAWPRVLARTMGWRVVVAADPGAGYLSPGAGHRGPFARLAASLNLARLDPVMVIVQGGHNDIGRPPAQVSQQVRGLVAAVRREAPGAAVGVLTVFNTGDAVSPATLATDQAIVAGARQADPGVTVFDPLATHWHYPRIGDQLHPSPAGHRWIAERLAASLRRLRAGDGAAGGAARPRCGTTRA